ncbi:MAG TPA: DUF6480 family protein [Citricoccus sp.]
MADVNPDHARNDPDEAAKATSENTGHSIEGDTPPAEGVGVGPTNPDMDVEKRGEGAQTKTWITLVLVLVIVFVVLAIIGRFAGFF